MRNATTWLVLVIALAWPSAAFAAGDQLHLVSREQLSQREQELTFRTPAVVGDTKVSVLLPTSYDNSGRTHYPVLYLLHGAISNHRSWLDDGDAARITAGRKLIVVMPDSGVGGGYVDWFNFGAFGPPEWETYHVGQLLPWIDGHYPTVGTRDGRAVAGLSMGGGGAMHYAGRHPDLFVAAAAFSPAVDLTHPSMRFVDGTSEPYGFYTTDQIRYRGHNGTDLAPNLRGVQLTLRTGNGEPGGPGGGDSGQDVVEWSVHEQAVAMHRKLVDAKIDHVFEDYGPGSHTWFYFQRSLRRSLPDIMRAFAHPPAEPRRIDYRSIDPTYDVWGWRVAIDRPALEWSELRHASRTGFELGGSGGAVVTTPGTYRPGELVRATIRSVSGTTTRRLHAGARGRLRVTLALGPGNSFQELSPQAPATRVFTTKVELRRERR